MILICFYAHNLEQQSRDACCVATLPPLICDPFDDARARTSWRWAPELANTCARKRKFLCFSRVWCACQCQREAPKSAIKSRSEPSTALSNGKLQVAMFVLWLVLSIISCHLSVVVNSLVIHHSSFFIRYGMVYCFLVLVIFLIGDWLLLITGYWLLIIGYWRLAIGHWL